MNFNTHKIENAWNRHNEFLIQLAIELFIFNVLFCVVFLQQSIFNHVLEVVNSNFDCLFLFNLCSWIYPNSRIYDTDFVHVFVC